MASGKENGMRLRVRVAAVLVAVAAASVGVVTASPSYAVNTIVCDHGPHLCVDRQGSGTTIGTPIIGWGPNFGDGAQHFTTPSVGAWVCGQYSTVHNGENGCVGPFTNGSGLNARYDGRPVVQVRSYGAVDGCVVPQSLNDGAMLNVCNANGMAWVANNAYLINVWASNTYYQQFGAYNTPWFLNGVPGQGNRLPVTTSGQANIDQWYFYNG